MKIYQKILAVMIVITTFSCQQFLDPLDDNHSNFDRVISDPNWADGLLLRGYTLMPPVQTNYSWDEVATDDAVNTVITSAFRRIGTGGWSALDNPHSVWDFCNQGIMYANRFLEIVDLAPFRPSADNIDKLYKVRFRGEAYAVRGILKYYLLRNHAGIGANDQLLGTPIYDEFLDINSDFAKPRDSFEDCVASVYRDFEEALRYLPLDYGDVAQVPSKFSSFVSGLSVPDYNYVCGDQARQRISGRIIMAFQARLALLHASPAFNINNNASLWETAADYAAKVLDILGGDVVDQLDPVGHIWYLGPQVARCNIVATIPTDLPEMLWRRPYFSESAKEEANFPPSLYGQGSINPSQNFVDAFPMSNGYPINHEASGYDPNDPYTGRDPRLAQTVIFDGMTFKGQTINTYLGNEGNNVMNTLPTSTRTGYYLKKMLREDVNISPTQAQNHVNPYIRYTEMFLSYAEAANEAWGPDGGPKAYKARDIIQAIRKRGGIEESDPYLASITDKNEMREMIQNERRIELSFESFRFWDLRRWKKPLNEPVKDYLGNTVEQRPFSDFMYYGPIPNAEVVKFNFVQNKGW